MHMSALSAQCRASVEPQYLAAAIESISALPHGRFVRPEDVEAWLETVAAQEPERIHWHARRLRGFGGSEMGAIVTAYRKQYHPFTEARDLIAGKLLQVAPKPPQGHTQRGADTEEMHRLRFRRWMSIEMKAVPADDVLGAMAKYRCVKRPWHVGNPDDAFWLPDRSLCMVDYKAPSEKVLAAYEIFGKPFDYVCQLHHYSMIAMEVGAPVKKLMLSSWDLDEWRPKPVFVDLDEDLFAEIAEAGEYFWSKFVMTGKLPEKIEKARLDPGALPVEVRDLLSRAGRTLALANSAYGLRHDLEKQATALLGTRFFAGIPAFEAGPLEITCQHAVDEPKTTKRLRQFGENLDTYRKPKTPDVSAMEARLTELGVNPKTYYLPGDVDVERLVKRLRAAGDDPSRYVTEAVEVKLSNVQGPKKEAALSLKREARPIIEEFAKAAPCPGLAPDPDALAELEPAAPQPRRAAA
jgi:hypothetical protein